MYSSTIPSPPYFVILNVTHRIDFFDSYGNVLLKPFVIGNKIDSQFQLLLLRI